MSKYANHKSVNARTPEAERIHRLVENAWMGLGDINELTPSNPLALKTAADTDEPHIHLLRVIRDPKYFAFTCKTVFNIELLPFQDVILRELWTRPFPMLVASRGASKSFLLGLYSLLRALLCQGSKIVIVGAAFRQAKIVFEYAENIWSNAPVLRDLAYSGKGRSDRRQGPARAMDRCDLVLGDSVITSLPLGNGDKIRGQRASHIIGEEFASIPVEIYEKVVSGFASVSLDPVGNVKRSARRKAMQDAGIWSEQQESEYATGTAGNQAILAGTADYGFKHFAAYWRRYKAIIESRGDAKKLAEIFGGEEAPKGINWRDYSVIRMPVELLPHGFMDERHISRAKATVHLGIYSMEFGTIFVSDSNGFFRRSLIESCVVGRPGQPLLRNDQEIEFSATLVGDPTARHVMAIDPAAVRDNFAITILQLCGDHRRVVYCWTTTLASHKEKLKAGLVKEHDFYAYCARKIRNLMAIFPCEQIAIDAQGGGLSVCEALHDPEKIEANEQPIWPIIDSDPAKHKSTDDYAGLHILEIVQFANSVYTTEANNGLRKDLEDKVLLFPSVDGAVVGLAMEQDQVVERRFDTLEDCVMEIEEMKNELATIVVSATPSGREHWDTPETKEAGGKKGRMRKDRYSALLMANMTARTISRAPIEPQRNAWGGFAHIVGGERDGRGKPEGAMYVGPAWENMDKMSSNFGAVVRRS